MSINLASKLREETAKSHTRAENSTFMKCFLKGIVNKEVFRKFTANLYFIYSALEEELQRYSNDSVIGSIYFPELNRKANLEEDLEFYYGENWREQIAATPACQTFVDRIREVAKEEPALLVAHSYVRYMGDLSGGQGLRNIARSAMDLPVDKGTRFYQFDAFDGFEAIQAFKGKYRQALNSLPVDAATAQKIANEANDVFDLNRNVLHDLEADITAIVDVSTLDEINHQFIPGSTEARHPHAAAQMVATE